jgi:coenzyme F420-0:L-glutamate ligase/coenzyme F420-1:gamma-L-glutamate ligase
LIQIIPVRISTDIRPGDDLAALIAAAAQEVGLDLLDGDIVVVAQKIVSKSEGRIVDLTQVKPSKKALDLAKKNDKDARIVQLILKESKRIVRAKNGVIIAETRHGFICANSGVDQSNSEGEQTAILLPLDPDASASSIRRALKKNSGRNLAVIITDTFGRPFRNGQTNVAIGVAGIEPLKSYVGSEDMYGKTLRVTEIAIVDEIASAAELVMGKADRIPAVIVRGYDYEKSEKSRIKNLIRNKKKDLFR